MIGASIPGWRLLLFVAVRRRAPLQAFVCIAALIATVVLPFLLVGTPLVFRGPTGEAPPSRLPGIPINVAVDAAGRLAVTTFADSGVLTLDGANGRVLGGAALTADAVGSVAADPATGRIYVTDHRAIDVLTADSRAVGAPIPLPQEPTAVAVDAATDRVYVATHASDGQGDALAVLDGDRDTILATIPIGTGPLALAVDPVLDRVYVADADDTLVVLDGATHALLARVPLAPGPHALAVNDRTHRVYVTGGTNNVIVLDAVTERVRATVAMGQRPAALAVDAATNRVYVADTIDNSVWLLQDRRLGRPTARLIARTS